MGVPPRLALVLAVLGALGPPASTNAWDWDGAAWADYRAFLGPVDGSVKTRLQAIVTAGEAAGRVEGRMGQIGDSITLSSAYFRNAILNGPSANETGHDYAPIRSWLAYSGTQPADANSFYRDHGKGPEWGNQSGWEIPDAVAAGHPPAGVLVGAGGTPGEYSWALVMFGTNDVDAPDWDVVAWKETLRDFLQGYVDLGVVPVPSTIPPELAHVGDGRVEAANAAVLALAGEMQLMWVDFGGLVLHHQPTGWLGTLISNDGTHPTAATGGRGFSQVTQTSTDGYALRTKLAFDAAEKLRHIVWQDGAPDPVSAAPETGGGMESAALAAFPNPTRGATTLRWQTSGSRDVSLELFDAAGRRVRTLRASPRNPLVAWDGRDERGRAVRAGVYFARLRADRRDGTGTTRVVVTR